MARHPVRKGRKGRRSKIMLKMLPNPNLPDGGKIRNCTQKPEKCSSGFFRKNQASPKMPDLNNFRND
jgi:hypothetical protein